MRHKRYRCYRKQRVNRQPKNGVSNSYVNRWVCYVLVWVHRSVTIETKIQSNLSLRPPDKSDHLKNADTQFQSLQFADSNVRTAFLKMRPPEKCEMRTPKVGPKRRFNLRKATTYVKLSEKHFFVCLTLPSLALRTSDHRVCKLRSSW